MMHLMGCVLFSADPQGIYVNWIGVSRERFGTTKYGMTGNHQPFQSCGLGKFLLMLAQTCLTILGWNINVFLQANQNSSAVQFYTALGFVKMASNNLEELPAEWVPQVSEREPRMYIKFVDDETNAIGAHPNKWLHLHKLSFSILETGLLGAANTCSGQKFFPEKKSGSMFPFPFEIMGYKLDKISRDLLLLGSRGFFFQDMKILVNKFDSRVSDFHKNPLLEDVNVEKEDY